MSLVKTQLTKANGVAVDTTANLLLPCWEYTVPTGKIARTDPTRPIMLQLPIEETIHLAAQGGRAAYDFVTAQPLAENPAWGIGTVATAEYVEDGGAVRELAVTAINFTNRTVSLAGALDQAGTVKVRYLAAVGICRIEAYAPSGAASAAYVLFERHLGVLHVVPQMQERAALHFGEEFYLPEKFKLRVLLKSPGTITKAAFEAAANAVIDLPVHIADMADYGSVQAQEQVKQLVLLKMRGV